MSDRSERKTFSISTSRFMKSSFQYCNGKKYLREMDTISTVGPLPYSSAHPHPRLGARLGQVSENPRKVDEKPPCMKQFPNTAHANRHKFGICDSHYSKPTPTTSKSQPSKPTPRTSQSQPSNLGDWIGQLTKSGQTTGSRDKAAQETRSIGSGSNTGHQTRSESNRQ